MQERDERARLAATEVLSGLYQAIADPNQIETILRAMDDFLDSDPEGLEAGETDWKAMFREHFGRVGQFLDAAPTQERDSPIVHVDKQVVPAVILDRNYKIIASNELFDALSGEPSGTLVDALTTPSDRRRLDLLFRSNGDAAPILVSFTLPGSAAQVFGVASKTDVLDLQGQSGPLVTIKVAKATWNSELVPLLESAYGLTPAEIEILQGLVEHGSVASVAEHRKRSVRTVRTQLTHIFGKLGLGSQTELALFLATLTQLMTKQKKPSDIGKDWENNHSAQFDHRTIEVMENRVSYVKYGDPNGIPVLMIHSTTPPEMTPAFREACARGGLMMIGAHKPGSGGATPRVPKHGPKHLANDYRAILNSEGVQDAVIAGHCSGGLYALEFANQFPDQTRGVMLVDTGVPFSGRRDLMALPKSLRRTFLPARYIPEVLIVPHRIFASNFSRSSAGEARVVDYFFVDCPVDQNLTRTDRKYYEITRRIIEYSFQDVDRLVADVCRWAKDWSGALRAITKPITFVHGDQNRLFESENVRRFVAKTENAYARTSPDYGQLQIYADPALFVRAVADMAGEVSKL